MKITKIFAFIVILALHCVNLYSQDDIKGGILDKNVNSNDEDYGSYVTYGTTTDTLFFTSSRPVPNRRPIALAAEIFYSTRPASQRAAGMKINEGWSPSQRIPADATRIAEFTRGSQAISSDRIIFAAERDLSTETAQGTSYLFDLWQMTRRMDGFSLPEPITEVNDKDAWDSQPALSPDGKVLFFVSNREGGMGGLDIWYSVRSAHGTWGKPELVPNINTPGDEVSPHCGADGKFYFSSDWNYSKNEKGESGRDIYRADYRDSYGISLPMKPVPLDEAFANDARMYGVKIPGDVKYNSDSDDEFPFISPDRRYIFITSNRKADFRKRNIYAFSLPKSRIQIQVNVQEQIFDANGNIVMSPTPKIGLPLSLIDLQSGTAKDISSGQTYEVDAERSYQVQFSKFVEEECYQNKIEGPNQLKVDVKKPFGPDTTYYLDALITRRKIEIPPIVFYSTEAVPYFITGYWYPNTSDNLYEYRRRESSGFFDETGFVDSTGHEYERVSKIIDQAFEDRLYKPLMELLPAFQDFCQDTLYLKVTIHGYTDPRGLSAGNERSYRPQSRFKRIYPDETITVGVDERGNDVMISKGTDMFRSNWQSDPNDKNSRWIKLPNEGEEGNVLLSKLRAYHTFVTFDNKMREKSPIYSQLRNEGRVMLDAEGYGIDKEGFKKRNLRDDPESRRIEIYLDVLRKEDIGYHKRMVDGVVKDKPATGMKTVEIKIEDEPTHPVKPIKPIKPQDIGTVDIKVERSTDQMTFEQAFSTKPSTQLLPPEDLPVVTDQKHEYDCFTIQYDTYQSRTEADRAKMILNESGVRDAKVLEYYDAFGNTSYRLRSGCYNTAEEASEALNGVIEAARKIGVTKKPMIVR